MIQGFDPRTGEPVGEPVPETTDADLDAKVAAAAAAFPAWSAFPRRAEALEAVADALDARAGELAAIADTETALGGERLTGEVARTTGQLRLFASLLRDDGGVSGGSWVRPSGSAPGYLDAVVTPAQGVTPDLRRINQPVGPVAVFAASNFPFAFSVAGGDTASALAAGCPLVVKAHEGHPVTSDVTAEIVAGALASAGAPAGTFGLVHGVQAGLRLLRHPAVAAAGFTGSTGGGLALARIAAERPVPIPFYGELGSVNPCVVLPGAAFSRPAAIATGYAGSLTLGTGQFCTNPGLLFVPEDVGLLTAIAEAVGASAGGPMLTGRIFAGYQDAVAEAEEHPGVTELAAGRPGRGPWGATPRGTCCRSSSGWPAIWSGPCTSTPVRPRIWTWPARPSRCSSASRAASSATAGRPASQWSPRSTTAARGRPPRCRPTRPWARPRSAAGWFRWPTRTFPRNCCR